MSTSLAKIGITGLVGFVLGAFIDAQIRLSTNELHAVEYQMQNGAPPRSPGLLPSFAPIVRQVAPSVVNVFSTKTVKNPLNQMRPLFNDPFFRQFFDHEQGGGGSLSIAPNIKEQSLGSGVIVTKDGYILTNDHVVEGADEIRVALSEGRQDYKAKLVGRDRKTDLAVLKIEGTNHPVITLGDSEKIEVGDEVLAVGNPFGVGQTVTNGIISAVKRGGLGVEDYEDFIQTDAAINPGNSGGPLVDMQGHLIGVNTAILSGNGGNQGIGFAVPANLARYVMDQLIKSGKVLRGYLGVSIQDLTAELAGHFKSPITEGALIAEVADNSAAAEAGIKPGDIVTEMNGKPVKDSRTLRLTLGEMTPGTKVEMKIVREGAEKTVAAVLRETPEKESAEAVPEPIQKSSSLSGVQLGDLDEATRSDLRIPPNVKGALITDIDEESAAFAAGLRSGDVIQEVNRKPVQNVEEAGGALKEASGQQVLLRIWSQGKTGYVVVG